MNANHIQMLLVFGCLLVQCHTKVIRRTVTGSDCNVQYIEKDGKKEVVTNCQNRNLVKIPEDLPIETTILDLGNNDIISFGNQKLLRYHQVWKLSFATNAINYIDEKALYGLPFLFDLDISGNNIKHIPDRTFSILPKLRILNIGSNLFNVTPDNALNLPKLKTLTLASLNKNGELHGSAIGAGFNRLIGLLELGLQDNGLTTLKNRYFTHISNISLQTIDLTANDMTTIEDRAFDELPTVINVKLNCNDFNHTDIEESLQGIHMTNLTALSLEMSNNLITITSSTFKYLRPTQVKRLDLAYSGIRHVLNNAFHNITTLETISMGSNLFTNLSDHAFAWLPALENVLLNYNPQLTSLNRAFAGIGLTNLDLSQSGLEQIPNGTFHGTDKMINLSLNENLHWLHDDSFLGLSSLTYLDLSDNAVFMHYDLHAFRGLDSLVKLFIDGMEMSNFTTPICEDLHTLKYLIADNISMKHLPDDSFKYCESLTNISLKGCDQLRDIGLSFRNIPNLQLLDLSANVFNEHQPGAFNISDKFGTLIYQRIKNSLNGEIISRIPSAIENCTHMDILDVSSNGIEHLNMTDIQFFDRLRHLRAYNNPYNCSCDMLPVIEWFQNNFDKVDTTTSYNDYRCSAPKKRTSRTLQTFPKNACWAFNKYLAYDISSPFAVLALFGSILGGLAYYNRSMLKYFYYIYREKKMNEEPEDLSPFIKYDAFISYSYKNLDFVKNVLLKNLETSNEHIATKFKQICDEIKDITSKLSTCVTYCSKVYANYFKIHNGRISNHKHHNKRRNKRKPSHQSANRYNITKNENNSRSNYLTYLNSHRTNSCITKRKHCCQNNKLKSPVFGIRQLSYTEDTEKYRNFVRFGTRKIKSLKITENIYKGNFKQVGFTLEKILKMAEDHNKGPEIHSKVSSNLGTSSEQNTSQQQNTYKSQEKVQIPKSGSRNKSLNVNRFAELPIGKIENKYGYKLMTCQRDFPVGGSLAETIVEYMERSRKSIICLSEDFLEGKWTMFEYEITIRERPRDMLVILVDDFDVKKKLPRSMKDLIKHRLFLQWTPNDEYGKRLFFEKLRQFLGKPLQQTLEDKRKKESDENPDASNTDESDTESLVSIVTMEDERESTVEWVSVKEPTLVMTIFLKDRNQILDTNKDLSDKVMTICLNVMKKDHPDLFGDILNIHNTEAAVNIPQLDQARREWKPFLEVIKIENENESRHSLIVSTHGCIESVIRIYDSKSNVGISDNLQVYIAKQVQKYKLSRLTLHIMNVPEHESEYDSSLHALANIMSLISNADLSKLEYADSSQMRQHLVNCLETESIKITPFPEKQSKKGLIRWKKEVKPAIKQTKPIDLHCVCHMPWDANMKKCIECPCLFHPQCVEVKTILRFVCPNCKGKPAEKAVDSMA